MGFVIWYQVTIPGAGAGGLPLRVSNDVFSGDYVLDADIAVDMAVGAVAGTFRVTLANLPSPVADRLRSQHAEAARGGQPMEISIGLGFFDAPAGRHNPVLDGVITRISGTVRQDGLLITELRGYDRAGYRLRGTAVDVHRPGAASLDEFVATVAERTGVGHRLGGGLPEVVDYTLRAGSGLEALRLIADRTKAPLVISDGTIRAGATVGLAEPVTFSDEENIVALDPNQEDEEGGGERTSMELTVLGDPALRAGQPVLLKLRDPRGAPSGPLRIEQVRHIFSTNAGYTCQVTVVAAAPGQRARRPSGVHRLVEGFRELNGATGRDRPAVDAGQTTVTVASDGAVTIATNGKDITFTNGRASITLTGDSVRLSGATVEVR